jgi:hypothetical protein
MMPMTTLRRAHGVQWLTAASVTLAVVACRNVLGVPVPAGVINPSGLQGAAGAETLRQGAIATFANAFDVQYSGLLSDEFTNYFLQSSRVYPGYSDVDARYDEASGFGLAAGRFITDFIYADLQQARTNARVAGAALTRSGSASPSGEVGAMFALTGYTELLVAEEFCAGVPLSDVTAGGGVHDGVPLTTDSLLGHAVTDFDSALARGVGNDTALNLARVGLGRALLDRGRYADAATAVGAVPTGFVYAIQLPTAPQGTIAVNFYAFLAQPVQPGSGGGGHFASVADREGGNGLNFISAQDPRMPIDSTLGPTLTGTPFYYPAKFPIGGAPPITLADWIEARLIQAEGLLQAGNPPGWLTALNTLRADTADTHIGGLAPLADPGTASARVDLMFRERAFWMFGTGHRLGDLRRLIRQYGRGPETVFPTGPYPATGLPPGSSVIPSYGTDVNFPIQAVEQANPNFHGCLSRGA